MGVEIIAFHWIYSEQCSEHFAVGAQGRHMVRVALVFATVARVFVAELQQFIMELLEMDLIQCEIGPVLKKPAP